MIETAISSRWLVATVCWMLSAICSHGFEEAPNIVLIYTDDQGLGDVSALNAEAKFKTPNLDDLIDEGLVFMDGHSSDTVCTPSRYGLLTGRYSWRTKLKHGVLGADTESGLIEPGRVTLATMLRNHGYRTGMFGKWHLGMQFDGVLGNRDWSKPFRGGPIDHGFEEFFGIPASMNYGVLTWLRGDQALAPATLWTAKKPGLIEYDKVSYRITPPYDAKPNRSRLGAAIEVAADFDDVLALEKFTEETIRFIEQNQANKFFAYVPLTSPHKPVIPAPEFRGRSDCGAYGDFMVETDHRIGQILNCLKRLDLDENTIVIVTSDNGAESTYRKRRELLGHSSSGSLRGGKRDLHEGGHRVPFLIRWPKRVPAKSVSSQPVCQTDLLATFAELLHIDLQDSAGEDSVSFVRALQGETFDRPPMIHHGYAGHFAIRSGKWKLIEGKDGNELYDLEADLSETQNLANSHPEVIARLHKELQQIVSNGRTTAGAAQENIGGHEYPEWCRCCRH